MNSARSRFVALAALLAAGVFQASTQQGVFTPLTLQGLDQPVYRGARSTAMGGATIAACGDAGALFSNPAALSQLASVEIRAGLSWSGDRISQTQAWIPNRFYPNFTLLMENLTGMVKDPVITDPKDALQKPYDNVAPNWETNNTRLRPTMAVAAVPFELEGLKIVAAAGFSHAFDLDYYFQNNNGLDPNIGLYRPSPMSVLRGTDTLAVRWFSSSSERKGAVYGITPGLSVSISDQVSLGAGLTILTGHSDDAELRRDRGLLVFDAVYRVQNYPVQYRRSDIGTSHFSGALANLGVFFREKYFSIAAAFKPPATITRDWDRSVTIDTAGSTIQIAASGSDKLKIPVSYSLGLLLTPTADWNVGIDYVMGQAGDAQYTPSGGAIGTNPWLSANILRAGVEYFVADWLALRIGYRDVARTFAPEGTGLIGEPVTGSVYAAGGGLTFGVLSVDLAFEYQKVKYQDLWETNVNDNVEVQRAVMLEVSVRP